MTAEGALSRAVADALNAATIPTGDHGAVALVLKYAALIDDAAGTAVEVATVAKLGPALLAALTALGMTAAGRGVKGGGPSVGVVASKLDELRERRAKRAGVDAS